MIWLSCSTPRAHHKQNQRHPGIEWTYINNTKTTRRFNLNNSMSNSSLQNTHSSLEKSKMHWTSTPSSLTSSMTLKALPTHEDSSSTILLSQRIPSIHHNPTTHTSITNSSSNKIHSLLNTSKISNTTNNRDSQLNNNTGPWTLGKHNNKTHNQLNHRGISHTSHCINDIIWSDEEIENYYI